VVGVPDELDRLWTPHRMAYIAGDAKPTADTDQPSSCPFCLAPTRPTDEGLVVARGATVFAILNLYPYNPGHLMVCPYRHVADYTDLDEAETIELARFTQIAMNAIRRVSGPHGFNLGMNQGHVAGAGIAAHLHQHVVPRWGGDTNFMPVIARTKTLPQLLADTRAMLAAHWDNQDGELAPALSPAASRSSRARRSAAAVTAGNQRPARAVKAKKATAPAAGTPAEATAPTKARGSQPATPTKARGTRPATPTKADGTGLAAPTKARGTRLAAPTKARGTRVAAPADATTTASHAKTAATGATPASAAAKVGRARTTAKTAATGTTARATRTGRSTT
jgi:ATP adenylyltransferase